MLFNSVIFFIFFTVFLFLYWIIFIKNFKAQNLFILIASYFFYAWWDIRFLLLLFSSSLVYYILGIYLRKIENAKWQKVLLYIGVFQGIGLLLFFKYCNFFISSLLDLFHSFNFSFNFQSLNIILPLGISFYTFKGIGYLLDIYNEKIEPTKDPFIFFTYLSFFPTLLSGPIDSAYSFIPQLEKRRLFDLSKLIDGCLQILWGFFKKLVVADNCAVVTNYLFDNYSTLPASSLLLASFLYTIQLYADFSGYSDMAIGFSRLMGFNVTKNFNFPFYAQNIAHFWQRWHISLTSWMTEYVFTPLSFTFRRMGKWGIVLAIVFNFILVGFWHGPNWTYILYGFLHGCYFIPLVFGKGITSVTFNNKVFPSFIEFSKMLGTFGLVMFSLLIFKASSLSQAGSYFLQFFSFSIFQVPLVFNIHTSLVVIFFSMIVLTVEWVQRNKDHALQFYPISYNYPFYFRSTVVIVVFWSIVLWGASGNKTFMYFKF